MNIFLLANKDDYYYYYYSIILSVHINNNIYIIMHIFNILLSSDLAYRYFKDNDIYGDSLEEDSHAKRFFTRSSNYQYNQTDAHPLSILIPDDPQRILYNRVPKSGSTTTRSMIYELSYKRNFTYFGSQVWRGYLMHEQREVCVGTGGGERKGVDVMGVLGVGFLVFKTNTINLIIKIIK